MVSDDKYGNYILVSPLIMKIITGGIVVGMKKAIIMAIMAFIYSMVILIMEITLDIPYNS